VRQRSAARSAQAGAPLARGGADVDRLVQLQHEAADQLLPVQRLRSRTTHKNARKRG
jgi:hypothetical protein